MKSNPSNNLAGWFWAGLGLLVILALICNRGAE